MEALRSHDDKGVVPMDIDDFRKIMDTAGVDVWTLIDTAMEVASIDYGTLLKQRRDGIVERLFALTSAPNLHPHGRSNGEENMVQVEKESRSGLRESSPSTPHSKDRDDGLDPYGGLIEDEQKKILDIKELLEIPHQSEDALVDLLQSLADMDITFQALKETDIGRHVNFLRKHSSNTVRKLVKYLVRKWKDIVDEWVRVNQPGEQATATLIEEDEWRQQKIQQNGFHQVPDFASSPNQHNGSSGSDRNNSEPEPKPKPKPKAVEQTEGLQKPVQSIPATSATQNGQLEEKESNFDSERLDSARKRLQANYKEIENAKKQRTIQVMDIHEIPKRKNTFYAKNKARWGAGLLGRRR